MCLPKNKISAGICIGSLTIFKVRMSLKIQPVVTMTNDNAGKRGDDNSEDGKPLLDPMLRTAG